MYDVGKRIKMYREQKGISQKALAEGIGAKNTTVSNWEQGLSRPDIDTLSMICSFLDVSADALLDIHLSKNNMTSQEKEIINQYRIKEQYQPAIDKLLLEGK